MRFTVAIVAAAVLLGGCNEIKRMTHSFLGGSSSSSSSSTTPAVPDDPSENAVVADAPAPAAPAQPAAGAVPQRDPYNALIGIWNTTTPNCGTLMFAAGSLTLTPPAGATYPGQTFAIDYQVNGPTDVIIIMRDNSKPPKDIQLTDSQHMTFEGCTYSRAA